MVREIRPMGQAKAMIWLFAGAFTLLYLLLWPFSLRLDARLSPTCGRGEVVVASLLRLRLEGDFLQPPYFHLCLLDGRGGRKPLGGGRKKKKGSFAPVIRHKRISATLWVGLESDGALTVEALGLLHGLLKAAGTLSCDEVILRPTACFDKNICALRLSGIGRFVLAQNILEYLKGKHAHAKR